MNNFEHHIQQLEALGFQLERGMLTGAGSFPKAAQIGTRFSTPQVQIDSYLLEAFFEADKSHPILGESQKIQGPAGEYTVTELLTA